MLGILASHFEWERRKFIFDAFPQSLERAGFNAKTAGFMLAKAAMESKPYRPDYNALNGQPLIPARRKIQPGERKVA